METRIEKTIDLMSRFAERTGLDPEGAPRRYLWTDAFAVCNFLGLARATGETHFTDLALRLVDQVHHTLGRHRADDRRSGWISGLGEADGEAHPTQGGLRIGKALPERGPGEPLAERVEWDRDGQYFHYLTRWMHALDQATRAIGDPTYNRWARELASVAHRAFTYATAGSTRRMYWKVSIDLSRPLVSSMGQHDPLDGYVTTMQLDATLRDSPRPLAGTTRDFAAMLGDVGLATADPLGLGGLLADAFRLQQVATASAISGAHELVAALLDAAGDGIGAYLAQPDLRAPADRRLAFRELGLAIGLAGVRLLQEDSAPTSDVQASLARCSRFLPVREAIESYWLESAHRQVESWLDHADINDVMLATSLCPEGFLVLRRPPTQDH